VRSSSTVALAGVSRAATGRRLAVITTSSSGMSGASGAAAATHDADMQDNNDRNARDDTVSLRRY
jgi:hypothetical protein